MAQIHHIFSTNTLTFFILWGILRYYGIQCFIIFWVVKGLFRCKHDNLQYPKMAHFSCFQLNFLQLCMAKLEKYKKVKEKYVYIWPFSIYFLLEFSKKSASNCIFLWKLQGFFWSPKYQNLWFSTEKRTF